MDTLIRNARVLTMDDNFTEFDMADILVRGTKIVAIGPDLLESQDGRELKIIDATGKLVMPGLINGHIHSPGNFSKGTLDGLPLEVFMLYEIPPFSETPPDYRLNYVRTMLSNMEMLKLGITSAHDDAFYVPYPTPDAIDGLMQSYADSGLRVAATIDQPNVVEYEKYPFLKEILPENIRKQMESAPINSKEDLLACYDHLISKWHNSYNGRIGAAVSISAPQRVTVDYFKALSDLSKKYDLPFDVHVLETKLQRVLGEQKYGNRSLSIYTTLVSWTNA
jgi:5-methylthioadenosine/S-adenosylhomocysteine deaminase